MKTLTICQHIVEVKFHIPQGETLTKHAVFLDALEGVSATFLSDIYFWLNSRPVEITEQWKGLPVFVFYKGGKALPPRWEIWVKGYEGNVHLINIDGGNKG